MKKYWLIGLVVVIVIGLILILNSGIKIKEFKNDDFKLKYDTTWKVSNKKDGLELIHKKTKSILKIQTKVLDDSYIDVSLDSLVNEISSSIIEQNDEYKLIDVSKIDGNYEEYSYLYENDDEEVLVNIYKYHNKLVISYYDADSDVFDIVLDSVSSILDSLEIFGE